MTAPGFWLVDPASGDHALVAGEAERDELVGREWTVVDQPADDAMVTIWREGITEPGRVPAWALRELWGPRGWVPGPPSGGTHPVAPKPVVEPAALKPSKSASGGEVKEVKPGA